jgi:hypothetical protein
VDVSSAPAIAYEVDIDLDAGIEADYRAWLGDHVAEILALPGFTGACVQDVLDPAPAPGRVSLCVRYLLRDDDALQAYLARHAPRLRADGIARFGGRFTAHRRVLRQPA